MYLSETASRTEIQGGTFVGIGELIESFSFAIAVIDRFSRPRGDLCLVRKDGGTSPPIFDNSI